MAVPFTFQNAVGNIPLANLDTNFDTPIVLGSTSITLGTTASSLAGLTSVTATTGTYTNLAVSGTVSGTGFSAYLASPPIIGSTTANAGFFTTLISNSTTTLNGTTVPASATLLTSTDIGTTVQGYDVNTAKYNAVTANFVGTLQNGGHTVLTDASDYLDSADIGVTVQGYSANLASFSSKTAPTGAVVGTTDTQTLSNKTITNLIVDGYIREEVFAVTGTTPALSPSNGTIQTWTLTGNSTPTQGAFTAGESMTLMINDGTAFTVTWTSVPVVWVGGTAPTLATTGFTVIELWEVGTTVYGALVGNVA